MTRQGSDSDPRIAAAETPPATPSEALRRRVLASIDPATRYEGFVERLALLFDLPEPRMREILREADSVAGAAWVAAPIPGVHLCHFRGGERVTGADCGLVHLAAGTEFPRHRHRGVEWTFVLSGSALEDGGDVWLPGDLVVRDEENVHGYRAIGDEPYLFAVVLHGGIEVVKS
jgi:quercetin dioxygenase-like cupin family protein